MHLLEISGFEFRFAARSPMRLPGYAGSAWRGGFGRALRRTACVTGLSACPGCPLLVGCAYPYLFETPPGPNAGILADYDRVPNPFVLAPAWNDATTLAGGDAVTLRLVLIGRAIEHSALARQAVVEAAWHGIGPDRGPLDLVSAEPIAPPPAAACPDRVTIELRSPLRLVEKGRLVGPGALRPRSLLLALLRRVSLLAQLHGPMPLDLDYRALKALAGSAEFDETSLHWTEWRRYSGRQQRLLPMGGLLGVVSWPLRGLEPFWPLLSLAPWIHVGKGATMGLGAVRVIAA